MREMYPADIYTDDQTRQLKEGAMPSPDQARTSPMMLRAKQATRSEEIKIMAKSLYLREVGSLEEDGYDFLMKKFDKDEDYQGEYALVKSNMDEWTCSCPARTLECRHVKMMSMFDRAYAGQDPVYNELQADEDGQKYVVYLETDNKFYGWRRGPEIPEE